ncbi:PAS domain-containing protein [Pleurocapsales cyanobacterium LEGE 06147]|nr:PAS domain-containing protein [Pleurocapsales cyanobacterium LEGE 06147]
MLEFWNTFFSSGSFIPHGHCYLWKPPLVWLHVTSDTLTALAYYSIPITLFYFVNKRKDLPFNWIFLLFCAFIVACGTTHVMEVWTLWHPTYWLSGTVKASTAAVSVLTALELIPVIPQALALPSPAQLEKANQELQVQIAERLKAEKDLKKYQSQLEQRVAERTAELNASNRQMEELLEREQQARAQAEAATIEIQRYAERLTLALEAAKMGSWDWDLATDEIIWTPYHEMIFGYKSGNPKRSYTEWKDRVHPEDLLQVEAAMNTALANRQEFDCQYRLLLPNGQLRWVDAFGRANYDSENRPVRMVGMVIDVTDRKLAEESLRQSEEMTRRQLAEIEAIYATAPIGLCVLDTEFRFVRLNEFLAQINGLPISEHLGRTIRDILPDLGELQEPIFKQVLESGQPVLNFEVHGETLAQSETERDWLVNYYPLRGINGQVLGINITVQEITDRKLVEKELQQRAEELSQVNVALAQTMTLLQERNQELAQFAYVVSHDLKAPLRAMANLSAWIEEDFGERLPEANQHQLQLLRKRVYRMEALIDGLLEYSRVGRTQADVETFVVEELLAEVIESLAPPETFTIEIESGMPRLTTKRLLLNQVFSNLISNAIKHHDRIDGNIRISVRERENGYEFAVSDDGPGIDSRYHQKIFAIFQTLKSRDDQKNTGVGLAIVKKIVETEGGSISVESRVGYGTTFRFIWPKQSIRSIKN